MRKLISIVFVSLLAFMPVASQAGMASSSSVIAEDFTYLLDNESLMTELSAMGISEAQLQSRLSTLTLEEQAQLSLNLANMPAGQDILSTVLLIFIIFIITDIIGATDVLPFVNKI